MLLLKNWICHWRTKKAAKKYSYFCHRHIDGDLYHNVWQDRANSMIRKAFTVWKERKQSHRRRRRKLAFPNCEPIDEQHSDNAFSLFIFVCHLRYTRCRITLFFIHESVHGGYTLKYTPIGNHNVGTIWSPSFTRRFIKLLEFTIEKRVCLS